jgi:monoterpene epsilon-lactone hydrolase
VFGDLSGFPPLLVHVGGDEVLLGDAVALAREASLAGSDVTLRVCANDSHISMVSLPAAGRQGSDRGAGKWMADVMARQ